MELNRDQIAKALDWLDSLVGNSNDSDIAMFTYQLLGILYDTCEELTEKNAIQVVAAIELDKQVESLTEENERLNSSCTELTRNLHTVQAATVNTMYSEIKERCIKGGIYPAFVASVVTDVAKELLEEE